MKNRTYLLTILTFGIFLSINAQEKPNPKNCDQYLTEVAGSNVRPDDGWCNYDGDYAKCQCENEQKFKHWRTEFDKNNRLAEEDKERLVRLEKSIIDQTKVIRDLNLNEDHENFTENKNKAIKLYEQAISQLSSLQVNYVNDENTYLKQNRVTLEKTKQQHIEYWNNEIALLKAKHPTKKVEYSFGGETGNEESTDDETAQPSHRSRNDKTLIELKSNLYETKKTLEQTGQTNTEEYRKTLEGIRAVELQQNRNSFSSYSNAATPRAYSDAAAAAGQLVSGFAQAYQDGTFSALRLFYSIRDFQGTTSDGEDILISPLYKGTFGLGIGKREVAMFTLQANFDEGYAAAIGLEFTILPGLLKVFDGEKDISFFSIGLKTEVGWGEGDPESNEITTINRTDTFFYGGGVFVSLISDILYGGYIYGKASGTDFTHGDYNDFYSGFSVGLNFKF